MVKCAIIPPSATTNGPFSFSSACPLCSFLLFCFLPPQMSLTVFIFLHHASSQIFPPPSLLYLYIIPFFSVPHLPFCLFLYPQLNFSFYLICCSFRFNFLTLSALKRTCSCAFPKFPCFFPLSTIDSAYPSHPEHVFCSHLGDTLTFPALSGL